ncbi:uncharacterized protein LOC106091967 isoform X1 [Stomoxys calcitrans]|uniref:uncharacterized protein LOC106091967 isoform X1 n=1 Tax=Stomoxys calcitrans TaxID=35570 RepID=UPI0027E3640F|nr:uncharacterized protein LOC106091967 isoform X1 [Stomoxys calcitrans]
MDARKNKMCKVRLLRRLRPELMDKLKTKRMLARTELQFSSTSSETEEDDAVVEKISVQLKSPLALGNHKDFDPFVLLTEAQQALSMKNEKDATDQAEATRKVGGENLSLSTTTSASFEKSSKIIKKSCKQRPYQSSLQCGRRIRISTLDSVYYHSDGEGTCSYNCNNKRIPDVSEGAKALSPTRRRSSTGSTSPLLSEKCSMRFSKLFGSNCISVMDDENPPTALSKILSIKEFDPLAPQQQVALIIKSIVSLSELSRREDNIVSVDIDKRRILEFSSMSLEDKRNCRLNPYMDVSNIIVTHTDDEFFTFCLCKHCEEYRELVIHIMVEQFKAAHMVVMLLDVLIKAYGPMLKNITAYNKFEKLLDSNKEIYWITCGVIYHKKGEHLDFIYDEYLSDNMIFVLFSSILMLNNPLLLLQILAFHIECIVKAYAEGFLEIVEPDQSKIPAEEMINYILNGYDDLIRISEQVASYLFAFENDFLRKFSLTWKHLCQRLYQQHVHLHLADTMLACIITLKEEELTSHHTDLIKRYIQFDDTMNSVEKRWTDVWIELNKFNLSEVERKRRKSLIDVYRIFDTVVQDAIAFSLQDSVDDNDFYDFRSLKNRRLAWKNIMSYTKMKWPDGFYQPPNTLVVDDRCKKCNVSLEYHAEYCKCITCSIAGGPMPPRRNDDGKCSKCLAQEIVEKDVNLYDSKIVKACANDDYQNLTKTNNGAKRKSSALHDVSQELNSTLSSVGEILNGNAVNNNKKLPEESSTTGYHIAWAVFNHLNCRKRFPNTTISKEHFCHNCKMPSCRLARKILNNDISLSLSQDLIHYYQPMSMSREDLRLILPNIMLYNRKLVASNNGLDLIDVHDLVVKIYWIFIISVYAIYFIDFDDDVDDDNGDQENPINVEALELVNNDIAVNMEKITGNNEDTMFLEFLDKIKSLSPYNKDLESNFDAAINIDSEEIQKKLNEILKITNSSENIAQCEDIPPPLIDAIEEENVPFSEVDPPSTVECPPKKTCLACKSKKFTDDHCDIGGDRCKENHSSKKRLKKDCNHARMNETRERLRKKLSQIVNARKNSKPTETASAPAAVGEAVETQNQMENVLNADELKLFQEFQQQLPESMQSQSWEAQCFLATFEQLRQAARHEEFQDVCDCLQYLQTNQKNDSKSVNKKSQHKQAHQKSAHSSQALQEPPNKKSNVSNNSTRDASTSSQGMKMRNRNCETKNEAITGKPTNPTPTAATNGAPPLATSSETKALTNLDFVSEICEIIDNYSKEQAKRRWIKETLSFIEGPTVAHGKKKSQPQTSNPKKAAKKAKQKQRKDEEKRIAELQDLRAQFQNIYFKEFTEKLNLKTQKANKKRDKKKIVDMENNIKNLQRAKAKVETAILELIATVKQTNAEFKFSYLPTKEQQVEKLKELEGQKECPKEGVDSVENSLLKGASVHHANETCVPSQPFSVSQASNLNMVPEAYSMPYAHANHFPYNIGFPPPAAPAPFGLMRATPMCYAPPPPGATAQQQPLRSDVVAAMTASATSNSSNDPSKRIVTIRRVNLPNVPEPQVTVTAKGRSPDKDKLLYTFINGQLVQTGTTPPTPPMPIISSMQPLVQPLSSHLTKLPPEHLMPIPPLPPQKLTKTQMKKERRRLAKLQSEADAAEEAEKMRQEEEHRRLQALEEQRKLQEQELRQQESEQQKQTNKKKKKVTGQKMQKNQSNQIASKTQKKENKTTTAKQNKLANSNSTTSVSTNENIESPLQLPKVMMAQKATKQKRSVSTTTSCSVVTSSSSSSSNNSISSQMNTRDNSVSSLKPGNSKGSTSKKGQKEQKLAAGSNNKKTNVCSKGNSKKKSKPPTSSSGDDDAPNVIGSTSKSNHSPQCKGKLLQNVAEKKQQRNNKKIKTKSPASSDTEEDVSKPQLISQKVKSHKIRRPKLVDNGQFDNNPFMSLHMHDSETDWSSSAEDADTDECEIELQLESVKTSTTQTHCYNESERSQNKKHIKNTKSEPQHPTYVSKKVIEKDAKSRDQLSTRDASGKIGGASKHQNKNTANKGSKAQQNEKLSSLPSSIRQNATFQEKNSRICSSSNQHLSKNSSAAGQPTAYASNRKTKNDKRSNAVNAAAQNSKSNATNAKNSNPNRPQAKNLPSSSNRPLAVNAPHLSAESVGNQKMSATGNGGGCVGVVEGKNNKRSQRNKKFQHKGNNLSQHQNCCSGIPNNMGYFNPNEVNIIPSTNHSIPLQSAAGQNCSYQSLAEQMQAMRLGGNVVNQQMSPTRSRAPQYQHRLQITNNNNNISIMDQLNRGVQVENLSLPPGITLTKVDPIKSEQLRQKSESIKKLAKPLQQAQQTTQTFHHSPMGTTIIAPPVTPMSNFFGTPYAVNSMVPTALDQQSGIIMVEANPPKSSTSTTTSTTTSCSNKQSKNKKRNNKSKATNSGSCPMGNPGHASASQEKNGAASTGQPKMITLRNPMFHGGPANAPATMMQQPGLIQGRPLETYPMAAPLPVDQPAAIIKNENGMYTIRNPALHQAVTNGLVLGGYRQFGNVNFYTPQEAAAEATKATMQQPKQPKEINTSSSTATSFSYFSNDMIPTNASHNNISISCTSVGGSSGENTISPQSTVGGLTGEAAVIQRPTPATKCISAIGSEIKSAQQQKQKSKEQQWSHFVPDTLSRNKSDNFTNNTPFLSSVAERTSSSSVADMTLQEKYQQSKYYNGFDVFSSGGSSSSATAAPHIHHSCGDDSPPPSITGYNSYLDGIPNTGVIRYDDASFLKNLIPGQNLNTEVSIHNVNDSNFARNANSPQAHRVEITPVFCGNRPQSTSLYEANAAQNNQTNYRGNYREQMSDFNNDSNLYTGNNIPMNLTDLEPAMKYDFEPSPTSIANTASSDNRNSILDLNNLLNNKNGTTGPASHCTSPYMDENTIDGFVQNMNSLRISSASTAADEQSSQINGSDIGHTPSSNVSNGGWW